MEELLQVYPILLYTLGIVLLVVLIILGIKLIKIVDNMNIVLEDVQKKTKSLNGLFNAIDAITDTLSSVSDSIIASIMGIVGKVFHKRRKKVEEMDENE